MKRYNLVIISFILFFLPFSANCIFAKPSQKPNRKAQESFNNELNLLVSNMLVCFEKGKYEINEQNINIINRLAVMLKSDCFLEKTISIHGHTDTTGEGNGYNNQKLSQNRAKAVYDYLIKQCNVPEDRMAEVVGWGITKPVNENNYSDTINRSVQFFVDHEGESHKFDNLIPMDLQNAMIESGLTIHKGNNPPKIEGDFEIASNELVFTSDNKFQTGKIFMDNIIKFKYEISSDNQIIIKYESVCGKTIKISDEVRVIGDGDKFTAYFTASGDKEEIYSKVATIISGEKTKHGIQNINVSFVMLEKKNDKYDKLMKIGDYRIFRDSDNLANHINVILQ